MAQQTSSSYLLQLNCPECGETFDAGQPQTICHDCHSPLLAEYDLPAAAAEIDPSDTDERSRDMWRWPELLPLADNQFRTSLGEGGTPLVRLARLGEELGLSEMWAKDEGVNPTGTFKARGLSMAVSMARQLGAIAFTIPTAGNAGGALASYAGRAGLPADVYMPADAPAVYGWEVEMAGANLHLVDGLIDAAGNAAAAHAKNSGAFNLATFREPYRVEGKKTMGYELVEALGWRFPGSIVYPTGGGTGIVGLWKAFGELKQLGWVQGQPPKLISVQAEGCAPIVRAIDNGDDRVEPWKEAHTAAHGLRVPAVFADRLILRAIRESGGTAVSVSEAALKAARADLAEREGVLAGLEAAACLAGLRKLRQSARVTVDEPIVLLLTGGGLKESA